MPLRPEERLTTTPGSVQLTAHLLEINGGLGEIKRDIALGIFLGFEPTSETFNGIYQTEGRGDSRLIITSVLRHRAH